MSGNSSSSNNSLSYDQNPPDDSTLALWFQCVLTKPSVYIFITFIITFILLLLPLCIFILHRGLQLWRQKRSTSSAATVSHCDCFTYHMVVMELVGGFGCILSCCGVFKEHKTVFSVGGCFVYFTWFGETCFHVLTCVERHLAVVHPITYLSLRNQRGIRIRNISITCVWLLSFVGVSMMVVDESVFLNFSFSILCLTVISFCSLSVLCVLIRPGPGEQGEGRKRVDQSKLRAFYTIMTILGVLVLRFSVSLGWYALYVSQGSHQCVIMSCSYWFTLPSSLVLPLLFLHRAGKLMCCKKNNQ